MVDKVVINDDALVASTASTTQSTTSEAPSERPSWLPEKFSSAEDMASAYTELEKKMSSGQPEEQPSQEQVEQATGLSLDSYYDEYAEKGTLSDESYNKLSASGLNKDLVDSYIQGQQALADATVQSIQQAAGGQEKYSALTDWASKNLSDKEQENFNEIMEKGSIEAATFAVKGLRAQYDQQFGIQPNLIQGQNTNSNSDVFRSTAEVIAAINNPKYQDDTHYRSTVEAKIKRSNVM